MPSNASIPGGSASYPVDAAETESRGEISSAAVQVNAIRSRVSELRSMVESLRDRLSGSGANGKVEKTPAPRPVRQGTLGLLLDNIDDTNRELEALREQIEPLLKL